MNLDEARSIYLTRWWEGTPPVDVARRALAADRLICPLRVLHSAAEIALGRPVWAHELADPGALLAELDAGGPS